MLAQSTPVLQAMTQKMQWLQTRQRVLSENIANLDTPGYRPNDLKEFTFKNLTSSSRSLPVMTSESGHMKPGEGLSGRIKIQKDRELYEVAPSGNAVTVEEQIKKSAATAMDYQLITNLYRKQVGMFRTAIGQR